MLATGLDGRSPKTITKNRNVLAPILKVIGACKLRELTAADVRRALSKMAAGYSTAAVEQQAVVAGGEPLPVRPPDRGPVRPGRRQPGGLRACPGGGRCQPGGRWPVQPAIDPGCRHQPARCQ